MESSSVSYLYERWKYVDVNSLGAMGSFGVLWYTIRKFQLIYRGLLTPICVKADVNTIKYLASEQSLSIKTSRDGELERLRTDSVTVHPHSVSVKKEEVAY